MTPERWLQIDQLFHAVLEKTPAERRQYLVEQCAGDETLRLEVESLLSSNDEAEDFIESPPGDLVAEMFSRQEANFEAGHQIGNYRIIKHLGAGGMGEVYLADDIRLSRKVALKLLPPHFTGNPSRVRRFEQEARAASALNHPNIVTIHEIGQSESVHFIATEFVDGQTLRQLMKERPLTLNETLNAVIQIAFALEAAHNSGIVHRDIKPENVMVRSDGYIKILDFGLAKLVELKDGADSDSETPTLLQSNPGLVMGTVQYMSPEQARAKKVDARTDIWSLGIVLYELLTGHVPFTGETPSHVMVSLMEDELPPLKNHSNVPAELDRIVTRTLRKNRRDRYQSASELASDLKNLKRELQLEAHLNGLLEATPISREEGNHPEIGKATTSGVRTVDLDTTHPTTSANYRAATRTRSFRPWALVAAISLVLVVLGVGLYSFVPRNRSTATPPAVFQNLEFTRLTNTGKAKDAVISPNGKYVAYISKEGGNQSIRLREQATSNSVELVPPAQKEIYGSTFSPDSNHLYYVVKERNNSVGELYRVAVVGGPATRLIVNIDSSISFAPDGKQFAFVRGAAGGVRSLVLANVDGSAERSLITRTGHEAFSFGGPAWLPDGKSIACGAGQADETGPYMTILAVDVADASVRPLTTRKWRGIGRLAWLKDGSGLILIASDHGRKSPSQLWFLEYPSGESRRITKDLHAYDGVSLTSDSTLLVSNQTETIASIWSAPEGEANHAKQILTNNYDADGYGYYSRFSWTPNGQILYTSQVQGTPSIWLASDQGTGNQQLTPDSSNNHFPSVTPEGRYVVFLSDRTGFMNVWRMDLDGKNEIQLTQGQDDSWPWVSPDGQWVVYHSLVLGKRALHRVSINGGEPEQLTSYSSICPTVSPDGNLISCYYRADAQAPWKLAIVPFRGGLPTQTFDVPQTVQLTSLVRWTPDGRALAYIANREGISNIWIQPLDGSPARQLTNFKSDEIFWFDWAKDGRQLGVSRGAVNSDIVMIKDQLAIPRE